MNIKTSLSIALILSGTLGNVQAQESAIETQSIRCAGLSLIHSTLTVPSPKFGEIMGELAGLFAQIHTVHKGVRTKARITQNELRVRRDAVVTELSKGWPGNKTAVIREAAICNAWRAAFFEVLPDTPSEKEFQAALTNIMPPPKTASKEEIARWTTLTPQAFAAWSQIKVAPAPKK